MAFAIILVIFASLSIYPLHGLAATLPAHGNAVWKASNFQSLMTFGDSYTDENRFKYIEAHNGPPPPGTLLAESNTTAGGGRTWARYVVQYAGSCDEDQWEPRMTLYNYAVNGAGCSNYVTPRDFPSVLEYELPSFLADQRAPRINSTVPFFTPALTPSNAVYAIWFGTNDMQNFLTGTLYPGKVLPDYIDCVYEVLEKLYAGSGRVFVLMNLPPLHLAPRYANGSRFETVSMHSFTSSANAIYKYRTFYETVVAARYPGASFANFDVNRLMHDMYSQPTRYFNGTMSLNVTGYEQHCVANATGGERRCSKKYEGQSPDSFMWFDDLHPSEQSDRIIAQAFMGVLDGQSQYAEYW